MRRLFSVACVLAIACALSVLPFAAQADVLQRGVAYGNDILIHNAADATAPTRGRLAEGDAVLVLEQSADRAWLEAEKEYWYRIEAGGGEQGWVHGSQLLRGELEGQIAGSGVRMRQTPGATGAFVQALSEGAWVTVLDRSADTATVADTTAYWFQVRAGNTTGWVFGRYVRLALTLPSGA